MAGTRKRRKAPTLADLRRAAPKGVTVWFDDDCSTYRATCDEGTRFDEGLHELVAWCDSPRGEDGREARRDLLERLIPEPHRTSVVEPCDDAGCDWCRPAPLPDIVRDKGWKPREASATERDAWIRAQVPYVAAIAPREATPEDFGGTDCRLELDIDGRVWNASTQSSCGECHDDRFLVGRIKPHQWPEEAVAR